MRGSGIGGLPRAGLVCILGCVPGIAALGCSYDWVHPDAGTPVAVDATAPVEADARAPVADGHSDAPSGCSLGCAAGEACAYPDFECGHSEAGVCAVSESSPCEDDFSHTYCFCGKETTGFCGARSEGLDFAICPLPAPAATFACGYLYCGLSDYCVETVATSGRPTYECVFAPGLCLPGACGCTSIGANCTCTTTGTGVTTATYVCSP